MSDTGETPNARHPWHWPEQLAAFGLALTILTLTSPFSTYEMALPVRALYWALALAAGWVSITGLILLLHRLPGLSDWPALRRAGLAVLLAALPTTLAVALLEAGLRPESDTAPSWLLFLDVAVICALIGGAMLVRLKPRLEQPAPVPARNPFLDRLPPHLGTALISLSMQDHYVEVTTAKGSALIHLRMADALKELADYPGRQIHRSHWISAHAFSGLVREDGKLMAHLLDDRRLPVSRSHVAEVRRMAPVRPAPHLKQPGPP